MPSVGDAHAQIERWRAEFPISETLIYLNSCSLTPLPRRGAAALVEYARTWTELGGRAWYQHWVGILDDLRADFARVLDTIRSFRPLTDSVSSRATSRAQ